MHWQWPNISLCQENEAGLSGPIAISNDGLMDMSCQWTPRLRRRAPARGHRKKIAQNGNDNRLRHLSRAANGPSRALATLRLCVKSPHESILLWAMNEKPSHSGCPCTPRLLSLQWPRIHLSIVSSGQQMVNCVSPQKMLFTYWYICFYDLALLY